MNSRFSVTGAASWMASKSRAAEHAKIAMPLADRSIVWRYSAMRA
ncbi:MAG: hypothetical protein AB7H96_19045 [Vicinamibacterales bacterium]